jgi:hypothetical protein
MVPAYTHTLTLSPLHHTLPYLYLVHYHCGTGFQCYLLPVKTYIFYSQKGYIYFYSKSVASVRKTSHILHAIPM